MKIKSLFFIVFFLITLKSYSDIIPADDLFTLPNVISIQLSPSAKYYAAHILDDKKEFIEIVNTTTMVSTPLVHSYFTDSTSLRKFYWTDDKTIYIEIYSKNTNKTTRSFIHLDFRGEKIQAKMKTIKAEGYIVSTLKSTNEKILFVNQGKLNIFGDELFYATYGQLETNNFENAVAFSKKLKFVTKYFTYSKADALGASTYHAGKVAFHTYDKLANAWIKLVEYEEDDKALSIVGVIDKNTLAVLSNKKTDLIVLCEFDVYTKKLGRVLYQHSKYDLTDARVDITNGQVEFVRFYDHGRLVTEYFSRENKKLGKLIDSSFKGLQTNIVSQRDGHDILILNSFSSSEKGKYYLVNLSDFTAQLIASSSEKLDSYKTASTEVFSVKSLDDQNIEAILTKPSIHSNGVLLVMPHGGPIYVRDFDKFNEETQYYASRGYSVLQVNYRGSRGFGKHYQDQGVGEFGKAIESDISTVVKQVRSKHTYSKMCSIGASYGGYSALMLAIAHPDDYACVVSSYGVYDLPLLYNQSNRESVAERRQGLVNILGEMRDELWDVSPLYFLEKLQAPILLIGGKKDPIAAFEQTNRLKYRLKQLGKTFETLLYENAGHGHSSWFGTKHELAMTEQFIRKTLSLPKLKESNVDKILELESLIIADGYDDKEFLEIEEKKAFEYYLVAAKLGNDRAMFNVGSYYHRGDVVEYDLEKTKKWYIKASDVGYSSASIRLASMYFNGDFGPDKYDIALQLFNESIEQESELAYLDVAKFSCLGFAVELNLEKCLKVLKMTPVKNEIEIKQHKKERQYRDKILEELSWNNDFIADNFKIFSTFLDDLYGIESFDIEVEIESDGFYKKPRSVGLEHTIKLFGKATDDEPNKMIIPLVKDSVIGVTVSFKSNIDTDTKNPQTIVKYRWNSPEIKDKNGKKTKPYQNIFYPTLGRDYNVLYNFDEDWKMVEGEWQLEILSLDNKALYQKTFVTKKM